MSEVKNKIYGALTVMSEKEANYLWEIISDDLSTWSSIETVQPDEIDKEMLADIISNPECMEFNE